MDREPRSSTRAGRRSVLLNGLGRYEEALDAAQEASDDTPELFVSVWAASELLEAATRNDEPELARAALERIVAATAVALHRLGARHRGAFRALLSEGEAAERLYREAIERLGRTRLRPELARAHLLYGEWLRRGESPRRRARAAPRGPRPVHRRSAWRRSPSAPERELVATGEKVRKRTVETRDELTAQERQIARLARDGLSNPEIGARLFLSPRTVEWHLRKVFAKLGIHSRRELADALPDSDSELDPGLKRQLSGVDSTTRRPSDRSRSLSVLSPSSWSRADCCLLREAAEHLEEVGQGGRELAVGGQRHPVDVGLRARDRVVIEAREPRAAIASTSSSSSVVGDRPVDVPVLLRARSVEIVGHEQDLERAPASDQPRQPRRRTAARDHSGSDLELAEQRVLARGEAQVAGQHELASGAAGASADRGDAHHRRPRQPDEEVEPRVHPGRTEPAEPRSGRGRPRCRSGRGRTSGFALSKTTTLRSGSSSIRPTSSASSVTVVAVIVLIGGWSNVTRQ